MDFSYSKFQKFVLIFYLFSANNGICSAKLHDFTTISGLIVFTIQVSLGEGTVISKANSSTPFPIPTSRDATELSTSNVGVREPRILKDLSKLNRQGCLAKMLCGIEVARPPGEDTTTMNDYAYLVKSFFDTFSFSGLSESITTADDYNDDEPPKRTRGDKISKKKKSHRNKPENENIKKKYESLSLEELLDGQDGLFGFRKRTAPAPDVPKSRSHQHQTMLLINNPRFDKTMYLDRKQREFSLATDEAQKLKIANEVGTKFRRGRQCRALFNTGFSFCPWQSTDLQNLLLNRTTYSSSITTTTTPRSLVLADSPYIHDSYGHLLQYQDDEFPNAFANPSTILIEADVLKTIPDDSEGKGFVTYDPNTGSNVYSYPETETTKKPSKKQNKKRSKKTSRESSEEVQNVDSSENSRKRSSSSNEEEQEESIENEEPDNEHDDETNSEEDTDNDSVEREDDEEDDYKSWSDSDSKESTSTETPKRGKTKSNFQKSQSANKEALKFYPTKIDEDYVTVAQNFARTDSKGISQDRYITGLPSTWDPNKEKWKYAYEKRNNQNENRKDDKKDEDESEESESSEEDEDNEDNTKQLEQKNNRFKQMEQRIPPPRVPPLRPQIRFRFPKFRGRRSIDYYTITESKGHL